jgi:hypothetical protein
VEDHTVVVNRKRVEQKLPLLMTDGPWYSSELDRNTYLTRKFRHTNPDEYAADLNDLMNKLATIHKKIDPKANRK